MGASQERAAFFNATLLVVTRHPGGPPGRPKIHPALPLRAFLHFIFIFIIIIIIFNLHMYSKQYKAGAPYREDSKLSLKRVKREQTEEEAGSHRGLYTTEPPEEGMGSFFFALAVRAIFAPVALGLGLGMERRSLLLGRASGVPENGVTRLDDRDDCQASPSAL
jgi:hypothetical protein